MMILEMFMPPSGMECESKCAPHSSVALILLRSPQRNSELRCEVLDGSVSPSALVEMDWKDLSTREQREKDEKIKVRWTAVLLYLIF